MRLLGIGVSICALSALGWSAVAHAQATGEIGGAPTMGGRLSPAKGKPVPPRSEPIVIGVGDGPFGRVEIVAQDTKAGLCISVDHPNTGSSSGTCRPPSLPRSIAIQEVAFESAKRRGHSLSEYSGFMQPSVAAVTGIASRRKQGKRRRKSVQGIVAVPDSDVLMRLHQSAPFGYFVADFRGCLTEAKIRVKAFDASGGFLGLSQIPKLRPFPGFDFCAPGLTTIGLVASSAAHRVVPG
jgi:hypothetical protein